MPTINNWSIIADQDLYRAPELRKSYLQGLVTEHPEFLADSPIRTSYIVGLEGEQVLTYSGTRYSLGTVDPAYEAQFPNARERLFNSLGGTHD